jgi:hypothetical protein
MTGYGFCGPMTATGTVFDAKAETATATGSRYRHGYRYTWMSLWLLGVWLYA